MKKYVVEVTKTIGFTATVEAHDADDAWEIVSSLDDSDFDVNSFQETREEIDTLDEHRGCVTVTISKADEVDFDVHYPATEVPS